MRIFLAIVFVLAGLHQSFAEAGRRPGHIYLFRGFANVFSTGMDTLASKLVALGYDAQVYNHMSGDALAADAAKLQKSGNGPIIIMGHSLGGPAAIAMARRMQALGAPVALIITFGPNASEPVPANVGKVINFYQTQSIVNTPLTKAHGFRGTMSNINLDSSVGITHFNIDKIDRLHTQAIAAVASVTGRSKLMTNPKVSAAHVESHN